MQAFIALPLVAQKNPGITGKALDTMRSVAEESRI